MLESVRQHYNQCDPRGEFTLIVAGQPDCERVQLITKDQLPLADAVMALMETGTTKKDAIKVIAQQRGLQKREVYQAVLG